MQGRDIAYLKWRDGLSWGDIYKRYPDYRPAKLRSAARAYKLQYPHKFPDSISSTGSSAFEQDGNHTKAMTKSRHVVLALADSHAGHRKGLCNPDTILWDEDEQGNPSAKPATLGPFQEQLWPFFIDSLEGVRKFAASAPIVIANAGDLTHGGRFMDGLSAITVDDQTQIGYWNLKPVFSLPHVIAGRLILGTGVHTFDGSSEAIVTRLLRSDFPHLDIHTMSHSLLTVGGATFDIAHHGPSAGTKKWTEGNVPKSYLRDLIMKEFYAGRRPPDVIIRAHFHTWLPHVTERIFFQGELYESHLILLPALCGLTSHGRQATKSTHIVTLGMVAIEVIHGSIGRIKPFLKILDMRTKEVIGE